MTSSAPIRFRPAIADTRATRIEEHRELALLFARRDRDARCALRALCAVDCTICSSAPRDDCSGQLLDVRNKRLPARHLVRNAAHLRLEAEQDLTCLVARAACSLLRARAAGFGDNSKAAPFDTGARCFDGRY